MSRVFQYGLVAMFLSVVLLLSMVPAGLAGPVRITLEWDPNGESDLAGYVAYWGTVSQEDEQFEGYEHSKKVGVSDNPAHSVTGLDYGVHYYFAVTAYDTDGYESGYSNEVDAIVFPYTVETIPARLKVSVDEAIYKTPETFDWLAGDLHALEAPVQQEGASGTRYVFSRWSDGGAASHEIVCPPEAQTYRAEYAAQYSLAVTQSPLSAGTVTPSGTTWWEQDEEVTVEALPNPGYTVSWSGAASGTANPVKVRMSGPKKLKANFKQSKYSLKLSLNPAASGTITKSPSRSKYVYGDIVTLTATPKTGYSFSHWSGDVSGSANPLTITVTGDLSVEAVFTQP